MLKTPHRRLVSQEDASIIARPDVPRSTFSGPFSIRFPFDAGLLIPFHIEEVYPGDHFKFKMTPFVRTATPYFPIMDNQRFDIYAFFVPFRIIWPNFVKLMGEQTSPGDSVNYSVPQITSTGNGFAVASIFDYMGFPVIGTPGPSAPISVSCFPGRAYNATYNAWYRDENLIASAGNYTGDLAESEGNFPVRRRAKSHDYFTSALPWPQKFVAPQIQSPVIGIGVAQIDNSGGPFNIKETASPSTPGGFRSYTNAYDDATDTIYIETNVANGLPRIFSQTDVNTFRQAMQVQVFLERMARGGTRYTEITENIFGVRNPDARLQRPEYIGGGSAPVQFTPIAQTNVGGGGALGALGAAGTVVGSASASYAATEHGIIMFIGSIKSELSYHQGVHKSWDRKTLYDFYNPAFAGLGEQAILRREIYATGAAANDDVVFGYQERWHELRTHYSRVAGLFRPTVAGNLAAWHLAQLFNPAPTLGQTFIEDSPPMDRVYSAGVLTVNQQYLADVYVECSMTRPLPMFGTPVGLGRF